MNTIKPSFPDELIYSLKWNKWKQLNARVKIKLRYCSEDKCITFEQENINALLQTSRTKMTTLK